MILYLHGFRSSPLSMKSRLLAAQMRALGREAQWLCPQLPASPKLAIELALSLVNEVAPADLTIIGSSLGGYYATWVAERTGCRAVLLNPAVDPARDLAAYIGEQTAWHDPAEHFFFRPDYIDELRALHAGHITQPSRYFAVIAKGDEVLDWREMAARYAGARQIVLAGGDHALSDFEAHVDAVLDFLDLS